METIDILNKCTTAELRQLSVYLEDFQGYKYVYPRNKNQKKCWLTSLNKMLSQKDLIEPEKIIQIKINIRWFIDHKIKFQRGMANSALFMNKLIYNFARNVTDTVIHLEDNSHNSIDIPKSSLILNTTLTSLFNQYPNTLYSYFYDRQIFYDQQNHSSTILLNEDKHKDNILLTKPTIPADEQVTDDTRGLECKVCMSNKICIVLTNCGHTFCYTCTTQINNKCATCRTPFTKATQVRMYI
jgi:hypothetical protein